MEKKEKKIYMKPFTEMFFVENPQLMAGTIGGDPGEIENPGAPIVIGEDVKGFDLWDDSEALYDNRTIWDE